MTPDKNTIDVCVVTTLRPEILERTLQSFDKHIKYSGVLRSILNIDVNDHVNFGRMFTELAETQELVNRYFTRENRVFKFCEISFKPNFARAVKTVWSHTSSEYVFNLEDDWEFIADIDLDNVENYMEDICVDYIRFPKERAPRLEKVALQPSLWRGSCVRELSAVMSTDKDPEKQLRTGQGNEAIDRILRSMKENGIEDYEINPCCKDIGREWREEHGYKKWDKNSAGNITWSKE
jgi:hypothetical protein